MHSVAFSALVSIHASGQRKVQVVIKWADQRFRSSYTLATSALLDRTSGPSATRRRRFWHRGRREGVAVNRCAFGSVGRARSPARPGHCGLLSPSTSVFRQPSAASASFGSSTTARRNSARRGVVPAIEGANRKHEIATRRPRTTGIHCRGNSRSREPSLRAPYRLRPAPARRRARSECCLRPDFVGRTLRPKHCWPPVAAHQQ